MTVAHILIVDGDTQHRKDVAAMIENLGLQPRAVPTAEEAIAALKAEAFDLILLDLDLQSLSSIDAARIIRTLPEPICETPIIAMAARMTTDLQFDCRRFAIMDVLMKPFEAAALAGTVTSYLNVPQSAFQAVEPIVDGAMLEQLRRTLSAHDLLHIVEDSLEDIERLVSEIGNGGDPVEIGRKAHELRSVAGQVGAKLLSTLAAELEAACAGSHASADLDVLRRRMVSEHKPTVTAIQTSLLVAGLKS